VRLAVPLLALTLLLACSRQEREALPNVRLGMAPRDVRERFRPGGEGTWQTGVGSGDDTILEWTAGQASSPVAHARFEFHLGMLVAIRAQSRDGVAREEVSATPKTVTVRAPSAEGGSSVTVLSRDCPTHHDEAESLASRAR
jgi:hypothetical protein